MRIERGTRPELSHKFGNNGAQNSSWLRSGRRQNVFQEILGGEIKERGKVRRHARGIPENHHTLIVRDPSQLHLE